MKNCFVFLALVALAIMFGCSKDEGINPKPEPQKPVVTDNDPWEKCSVRTHPYNIENIMEAQRELGGALKSAKEMALYKYVSFKPDTSELKVLIQDTTIKLYDLPLADPKLYSWRNQTELKSANEEDTTRKTQYAILPLDKIIPNNVSYTVLDTLYFPDYETETDLYFAAHILAGTIKVDSAAVDSMFASTSNLKSAMGWGWLKKAVKWVEKTIVGYEPSGTLTMNGSAVEGVQVEVIAWGLPYSGQTNAYGSFHISKNIHVWSVVYLTFENNHCNIKLWNLETWYSLNNIMGTARYYVGDKAAADMKNMSITLDNNSWGGMCATIINAVEKYHQQANALGIGTPPKVNIAAIWGKSFSQGAGSAPMLNLLLNPVSPSDYFGSFLKPLLSLTNDHFSPFSGLIPDIIIPQTKGFDNENLTSTTLHELTHAAHAYKIGRLFWSRVVAGELNNMRNFNEPYGKRTSEFSGAVGLAEAWANDVENMMMYRLFGNASTYIRDNMENWYSKANKDAVNSWLPNGLFFDLYDINGQYKDNLQRVINETNITDNVSGISYSSLYSNFSGSFDNLTDYKNRLKSSFPAKASDIETLFNQYSF